MSYEGDLEDLRRDLTDAVNRATAAERSLANERLQGRLGRERRKRLGAAAYQVVRTATTEFDGQEPYHRVSCEVFEELTNALHGRER